VSKGARESSEPPQGVFDPKLGAGGFRSSQIHSPRRMTTTVRQSPKHQDQQAHVALAHSIVASMAMSISFKAFLIISHFEDNYQRSMTVLLIDWYVPFLRRSDILVGGAGKHMER